MNPPQPHNTVESVTPVVNTVIVRTAATPKDNSTIVTSQEQGQVVGSRDQSLAETETILTPGSVLTGAVVGSTSLPQEGFLGFSTLQSVLALFFSVAILVGSVGGVQFYRKRRLLK